MTARQPCWLYLLVVVFTVTVSGSSMDVVTWRHRHMPPESQSASRIAGLVGVSSTTRQQISPWHSMQFVDDIRVKPNNKDKEQRSRHNIGAMFVDTLAESKPKGCSVLVVAAYHAREPGTTQVAVEFIRLLLHHLRDNHNNGKNKTSLTACNFTVVWNANPSGYQKLWQEYHNGSKGTQEAWRKNARGVDLYRNFPSWSPRKGGVKSDNNASSSTFRGNGASMDWSATVELEEETRALIAISLERKVKLALCLHSAGDVVFIPKGEGKEHARLLLIEARRLAQHMSRMHQGFVFNIMPSQNSGTHSEYLVSPGYQHYAGAVAFTVELFAQPFPSEHEMRVLTPKYAAGLLAYVQDHTERQPVHQQQCDTANKDNSTTGFNTYERIISDVWSRRHNNKAYLCSKSCQFYSAYAVLKLAQIHEFFVYSNPSLSPLSLQLKEDTGCRWKALSFLKLCRYTETMLNKEVTTRFGLRISSTTKSLKKEAHRTWQCKIMSISNPMSTPREMWFSVQRLLGVPSRRGALMVSIALNEKPHGNDGQIRCAEAPPPPGSAEHMVTIYGQRCGDNDGDHTFTAEHYDTHAPSCVYLVIDNHRMATLTAASSCFMQRSVLIQCAPNIDGMGRQA